MAVQTGLCGTWSVTPKTGFLTMRLIYDMQNPLDTLFLHLDFESHLIKTFYIVSVLAILRSDKIKQKQVLYKCINNNIVLFHFQSFDVANYFQNRERHSTLKCYNNCVKENPKLPYVMHRDYAFLKSVNINN